MQPSIFGGKTRYTGFVVRMYEWVTTSWNSPSLTYKVKFEVLSRSGFLALAPLQFNSKIECDPLLCEGGDTSTERTFDLGTFDDETEWLEHSIQIRTHGSFTKPVGPEDYGALFRYGYTFLPEFAIGLPGSTDLWSWLTAKTPIPPNFRCDGGNKAIFGRTMRNHGCVFPEASPPTLDFFGRYPAHSRLVMEAQYEDELPGNPRDGRPLYRLPAQEAPRNRSVAKKMCTAAFPKMRGTCDEYPYASSIQGCRYTVAYEGNECRVEDVPGPQNFGAGGMLGWMYRKQRLAVSEPFFVAPGDEYEVQ